MTLLMRLYFYVLCLLLRMIGMSTMIKRILFQETGNCCISFFRFLFYLLLTRCWWFIYGIIFSLFNVVWNIITPYENHWLYVGISASLSLMASLLAGFYSKILNLLPFAFDGRWIILLIVIIFLTITIIFERISV